MVLKDNVSTIDSKPGMNQEFKSEGQGHKISFFRIKKQGFLADLNQYCKAFQKVTKRSNSFVIENYVYYIDSET